MQSLTKNQILGIIIAVVLMLGGIIGWALFQEEKSLPEEKGTPEKVAKEEMFGLSAVVLAVDIENNFLITEPSGEENEIKVFLSETTELIKLEAPFDSDNPPPPGTQFTPEKKEITLDDFKEGDEIFIKTFKNIAEKNEFNDVEFVQILP